MEESAHNGITPEAVEEIYHETGMLHDMAKCVDRSAINTSAVVVLYDGEPQSDLCQKIPKFITEQIIRRSTTTNCHVIPQNANHSRTEGDNLNLAILRVSENNLLST